ncbi:hypothetical protein ACFSSA_05345 [Luteolibacter algae]|uniref:Uncharacterized protein n=1 Tax=Luteolibacter algae TaxID=454151 RepID=A0ABW5D6B0_9BACT
MSNFFHKSQYLAVPLTLCLLGSCKDKEIRTYKVATDSEAPAPADPIGEAPQANPSSQSEAPHDHAAHSHAVTWQAGTDWKMEEAGQFLTAAYALPGGGRITVSKLGGDGGGLAANINRWRAQTGQKPLPEDQISGQPMKVPGSERSMQLFNLLAEDAADDREGILAAILPLDSETWYFKFTGSTGQLKKSGGTFMEFLRTVRIVGETAAAAPAPPAGPTGPTGPPKIEVKAPDGWTVSQGSAMRAASFSIAGGKGASADVSVIPLPGDSGSVLDNVNRWRSQLQLQPLASEEDPALGSWVEDNGKKYFISHMLSTEPLLEGRKAAISTAILKQGSYTWFFKITGDAGLVQENRGKFEVFVRSATFP